MPRKPEPAQTGGAQRPRRPLADLIRRYRAVFSVAWERRHELDGPKFHENEAAFLPAALSLQHTPVHSAPRLLAYVIIALFLIALLWSILGEIDIVATAPGRIIVGDRTKLIQPLERSVVKRVLIRDGDRVAYGQALVELDATIAHADKANIDDQLRSAESELARSRALLKALAIAARSPRPTLVAPPELGTDVPKNWTAADRSTATAQLAAEWNDIAAKLAKLNSEVQRRRAELTTVQEMVAKFESTVPLARTRESDFKKLAEQGFVAGHATQDRTRERLELERDLATQRARQAEAQAAIFESESTRQSYLAETRRTLSEREAAADLKRGQGTQEQAKANQRELLTTLRAPVAGTVQQLAVHTEGGVVTEAQALMVIVPDDTQITAEVVLDNKDIGFVNVGQAAEVKLETFPFTRYGTIGATVTRVTADAVNDEKRGAIFPIMLSLNRSTINVDGKAIKLSPGMNVTAEIKTGKRRVIDYLLSPVQQAANESLRER